MKLLYLFVRNPIVRAAIYHAYRGECFYTGRSIKPGEMVIDHLICLNKGGTDSLDNYVLTFKDLNLGKGNKLDEELFRMKWAVEKIFAPRAQKYIDKIVRKKITKRKRKDKVENSRESEKVVRIQKPSRLKIVHHNDLFWGDDKKIEVLSSSKFVTEDNILEILPHIQSFGETAII